MLTEVKPDYQKLASEFCESMSNADRKQVFKHITDEQLTLIKNHIATEHTRRQVKRYYRFECLLTNEIVWCVESKLGARIKSKQFNEYLKSEGKNRRRADRNNNCSIYIHPETAKKPYLDAEALEAYFQQDPKGKAAQPNALEDRPKKLAKLQA